MEKIYNFYDFITDENGDLVIRTFQAAHVMENDKRYLRQIGDCVHGYPYDAQESVAELRKNDYFSWDEYVGSELRVSTNNLVAKTKLISLTGKGALLNKFYDDKAVVDGMSVVAKYVHYVDVRTGKQFIFCLGTEKISEEAISSLLVEGYVPLESTPIMSCLDALRYDTSSVEVNPATSRKM